MALRVVRRWRGRNVDMWRRECAGVPSLRAGGEGRRMGGECMQGMSTLLLLTTS